MSRLVTLIHELLAHSDAPTLQMPPNGLAVRPVALPDDGQAHPVAVQPDNLIDLVRPKSAMPMGQRDANIVRFGLQHADLRAAAET